MRLPAPPKVSTGETLIYYCDESHIRTSDYMAVAGLAVTPSRATRIENDLVQIKKDCGVHDNAEVKWSKCKKRYQSVHSPYIDYLFDSVARGHVHFHIRFSPFKEYDHSASGKRRETDTISKAFYQLLLHRAGRYYGKQCRLLVRPDDGDCTSYLPTMRDALNNDIQINFRCGTAPIADIAPRNSRLEPVLQMLDVSLGALTAARNGNHENGVLQERKIALVHQALDRASIRDITKSDPRETRGFNIWNVMPMWRKGAIPTR